MNGAQFRGSFYDVRTIQVSLPRLDPDTEDSCPVPLSEVTEHVTSEFDDGTSISLPLRFLRTAKIGKTAYWIWTFHDPRRGNGYAVVALWDGDRMLTDCDDSFDMTPEQFIVALHFQIEA
jgi:hypothetical protein